MKLIYILLVTTFLDVKMIGWEGMWVPKGKGAER